MSDIEVAGGGGGTALDPRIQEELERLNSASAEINNLEIQLDDSRQLFRQTLTESTHQLNEKLKKCRKSAGKAQDYYFAREEARKAQESAQEAALRYQRASSMFQAAKETISIAEEAAIPNRGGTERRQFDSALQEMLNLSTMKLNSAEREKVESQREHENRSQHYIATQQRVDMLAKKFKRSIANSASYYDLKKAFFHEMNDLKARIEGLQKALHDCKGRYHGALKSLEQISEDIHQSRHVAAILAESRQSGVGADSVQEPEKLDIPFDIDETLENSSMISTDAESLTSEPTSSRKPKFTARSVSGSSLPSSDRDDDCDVGKRITAGRGSIEGAASTFARQNRLGKDKYEDDNDDDEEDGDDIVFGAEIDDDSDDSDDEAVTSSNNIRKLRTISIGELRSFSVFDGDSDVDGNDNHNKGTAVDEHAGDDKLSDEATPEVKSTQNDTASTVAENENCDTAAETNEAASEAMSKALCETVSESNGDVEHSPKCDDTAKVNEHCDGEAAHPSTTPNDSASPSEQVTTEKKTDDDTIWI